MTNEQKRVVAECITIIREAALQTYFVEATNDADNQMLDHLSRRLDEARKMLAGLIKSDGAASQARSKSLPRLLNEGIL